MMRSARVGIRLTTAAAATAALASPALTTTAPTADAAPRSTTALHFELPAVGGPDTRFRPITIVGRPGIRPMIYPPAPATVEFSVVRVAPYHDRYASRYVSVDWRNLRTGKTGRLALRHWDRGSRSSNADRRSPGSLRPSAIAQTGSGPVVARVSEMRRTPGSAPDSVLSVLPGAAALDVPR